MPPKGAAKKDGPSKKTEMKKKEKIIEDKTFGLKNKKGAKQQKYITMVDKQVKDGGVKKKTTEPDRNALKEQKKKEQEELNKLFRPVQSVGKGADPKSVVCAFFKLGQCKKGEKCKFSHDLTLDKKAEKRSMYIDMREDEDNMDNWDEAKLEEVVNKKHGETNKKMPTTTIICKFFLDAVEGNKYGWFWQCPNGAKCHYKHALPPGFVLKKDQKKEDKADQVSLEELIERERAALGVNLTKITLETFVEWKKRKRKEKIDIASKEKDKKKTDFKQGRMLGISGREMFEFNPETGGDDDDADDVQYEREDQDEEEYAEVKEINLDDLASMASEVDGTGTARKEDEKIVKNGGDESAKLDVAAALPPDPEAKTAEAISAAMAATINGEVIAGDVPIDENLFDGEDLDLLEEDLDTLDLDD
ncbi:zinc finger CCCH domain-containing protein 15-like [Lineus longissimus]|uniref:zinc finger CCCH domain-containing protein 15-like n=1 Tax=Lineus longissimus TaxID=88925 RepID=UPI00315DA89E